MATDSQLSSASLSAAPASAEAAAHAGWRTRLVRRLWVSDLVVLMVVVFGTQLLWFGLENAPVATRVTTPWLTYWVVSVGLVVAWMWALALSDSRAPTVIGAGNLEYTRVASASVRLFGLIAIVAFLVRFDIARGYLLISLPAGIVLLVASRWIWRQWLVRRRVTGDYSARALLIGSPASVREIAAELQENAGSGYVVVGACQPSGTPVALAGVPVWGEPENLAQALATTGADTVILTGTDDLPPTRVKQISWQLEAGRQHLVLAPGLMDVAGPRIHTRPVAGLPLIHVETPKFSGGQRLVKRLLDIVASLVLLVILSPLLLVLAIAVRMSGSGPVLFRQERVGLAGRRFHMLKFRSMIDGAEGMRGDVAEGLRAGNHVLYKRHDDPRTTPLGRWMRRHSLDELPQLINVVGGSMSLVGPRPSLPYEVAEYADHVHRRFLVKPGMTGAWQVGGRSTLSWEDSVRLDLGYVENWTLLGDLVILARTVRAVVAPGSTAS